MITPNSTRPYVLGLWVGLLGALMLSAGCATQQRLSISPSVESLGVGDSAVLAIEKTHRVTVELLTPTFSDRTDELPAFDVSLQNRSGDAVFLLPAQISVYSGEQLVRAYTASELGARIQEELEREAEAYTGQQAEVFLQSGATRQDPSSAMAAIPSAKRANRAAANRESRARQRAEASILLEPVRVPPGETASGVLKLHAEDILPNESLRLVITIDGEAYEYDFDVEQL